MSDPTVSIIIPTRNRSELVKRAIRSALNQSYDNVEVVVIDDGSAPEHLAALSEFEAPGLTILKNQTNRGGPYSRNRGWKSCNGDFIIFLDDDDQIEPEKVELQIRKFKELDDPEVGVVTSHAVDYRSSEKQIKYIASMTPEAGYTDETLKTTWLKKQYGVESKKELTKDQASEVIHVLQLTAFAERLKAAESERDLNLIAAEIKEAGIKGQERKQLGDVYSKRLDELTSSDGDDELDEAADAAFSQAEQAEMA